MRPTQSRLQQRCDNFATQVVGQSSDSPSIEHDFLRQAFDQMALTVEGGLLELSELDANKNGIMPSGPKHHLSSFQVRFWAWPSQPAGLTRRIRSWAKCWKMSWAKARPSAIAMSARPTPGLGRWRRASLPISPYGCGLAFSSRFFGGAWPWPFVKRPGGAASES